MHQIYRDLAGKTLIELQTLAEQLQFHPDPWAVGARKLIEQEIWSKLRAEHSAAITVC